MISRYDKETVRKIADMANEFTHGEFVLQDIANPGDGVRYIDGKKIVLVWRGKDAARKAAAYYAGAAVRWAELDDTMGKLPDLLIEASQTLDSPASPRPVRAAHAYGRGDALLRHEVYRRTHRTAQVGEQRTLTLVNRHELIVWAGGRAPDDPGSDVLYVEGAQGRLVVALRQTFEACERGFKIVPPTSATGVVAR